jgi:hypothetical protein
VSQDATPRLHRRAPHRGHRPASYPADAPRCRLLGDMLGEVLRESGGQDLLDDVEDCARR